ncbi:unnamed protein product, partial [Ascophyllum nodosum]
MTFDLKRSFILDELIVYFHKSNDTGRDLNPFNISISADEETGYIYSFNGVNNGKTPLGTGENFSFPARSSGRYVRFTPILADEQWCSINEVTSLVLMSAVTHDTFEEPYAGTIDITCAPADTPSLPTNSLVPSVAPTMTVIMTPTSVPTVAPVDTPTGDNDEGNQNSVDGDYIPMIIGSLVGAVAVLGLVGFVAYRKIKTRPPIPPPLPSYDDLV